MVRSRSAPYAIFSNVFSRGLGGGKLRTFEEKLQMAKRISIIGNRKLDIKTHIIFVVSHEEKLRNSNASEAMMNRGQFSEWRRKTMWQMEAKRYRIAAGGFGRNEQASARL
jgi:hypothetical protein